jgi:hypothetical protein
LNFFPKPLKPSGTGSSGYLNSSGLKVLKLHSALSVAEKVNFTDTPQVVKKVTAELGVSQYIM